jgi:hypothetical protein
MRRLGVVSGVAAALTMLCIMGCSGDTGSKTPTQANVQQGQQIVKQQQDMTSQMLKNAPDKMKTNMQMSDDMKKQLEKMIPGGGAPSGGGLPAPPK